MKNTYPFFLKAKKHWHSRWYTDANYRELVHQDLSVRNYIGSILKRNNLIYNRAIIKRDNNGTTIYIRVYQESYGIRPEQKKKPLKKKSKLKRNRIKQKPSIFAIHPLIYKRAHSYHSRRNIKYRGRYPRRYPSIKIEKKHLNKIKKNISELTETNIKIIFMISSYLDAQMMSQFVAKLIERRKSFRSISRILLEKIADNKRIQGIRIQCSGRPTGKPIAIIRCSKHGPIYPSTYDASVDYAYTTAWTKFGICGIKLWVNFHK